MVRPVVGALMMAAGLAGLLPAQRPVVTIASNGIVRVSQRLPLAIPAGRSEQRVVLPGAIAVSLTSATEGVRIIEVRREMVFDGVEALRTSVGREFEFDSAGGTVRRRFLGLDPERWSHPSGAIDLARPGRLLWPADLMQPVEGLLVSLVSDRARSILAVEYEASGGNWSAVYELRLGATATFSGTALLGTALMRLDTATVRLLAGDLGSGARSLPSISLQYRDYNGRFLIPRDQVATSSLNDGAFMQSLPSAPVTLSGQVYRYELASPVVFQPGREVAVPLLAQQPVRPVRRLSAGGALNPRGEIEMNPGIQQIPVLVSYDLARQLGTPFGDAPLPGGIVSVFDVGQDGIATLMGRASIRHVAPGSPLGVDLGASFDVTATRTQTAYQIDARTDRGTPSGATVAYRIQLRNAGDSAVTVTTYESRLGEWSVLESSHPAERQSSGSVAFAVTVPARGEAVLTYRVRATW
jgi:hypothetical protein